MAQEAGFIGFVVQDAPSEGADQPASPSGTVVQYATEDGIVFQTDQGATVWYCDFPQTRGINSVSVPYDTERVLTSEIIVRDNIGAENGAQYTLDVDIEGYDDGGTADVSILQVYTKRNGSEDGGSRFTIPVVKSQGFRTTLRINLYANPNDEIVLCANSPNSDYDALFVTGGGIELRRSYYAD